MSKKKSSKIHDLNTLDGIIRKCKGSEIISMAHTMKMSPQQVIDADDSVVEEGEKYRFMLNAIVSGYRPFLISEDMLRKLQKEVIETAMPNEFYDGKLMEIKRVSLPFDRMAIFPESPKLDGIYHVDFPEFFGEGDKKMEVPLSRVTCAGLLLRFDMENLDVFELNRNTYRQAPGKLWDVAVAHGRCTAGTQMKANNKLALAYRTLEWISSQVIDHVTYLDNTPKRVASWDGTTIINRHVNETIYLKCPREIKNSVNQGLEKHEFDFRFEVMGHWRRIKGQGKDMFGDRNQSNRTWVDSHEKGPKDAPFKKQLRHLDLNRREA